MMLRTPADPAPKPRDDLRGDENHSLSVIIPVRNGRSEFRECLDSITKAASDGDEVIVVVDGCCASSELIAKEFDVRVVRTVRANGPAAARNLGARLAAGDILFFVDADVAVPPAILGQVKRIFQDHRDVSAVIGSYDDEPAARNFLSQYKNLFQHYVHQNGCEEGFTFWGACGAIRREVFLDASGFDESYRRPCIEDIEFGYRLRAAGHRIRLDKALHVKHLKCWTAVSLFKSDLFGRALPWSTLILQGGRLHNDLNIRVSTRLKIALVYCLAAMAILSCWWTKAWLATLLIACLLGALDLPLLRFFAKKRGLAFAVGTLSWHWFYYWYSGLAWMLSVAIHRLLPCCLRDALGVKDRGARSRCGTKPAGLRHEATGTFA